MSAIAAALLRLAPALDFVSHLPPVVNVAEAGWSLGIAYAGYRLGWIDAAVREIVGYLAGWNASTYEVSIPWIELDRILINEMKTAALTQGWSGLPLGRTIFEAFFDHLVREAVSLIASVPARISISARYVTHLPWAFDLIWLGQIMEYIDADTLAFIAALSGAHPVVVATYIAQSIPWLYEMEVRDLRYAVDRAIDDYERMITFDLDVFENEGRWWFSEALRTYHRAILRMMYIVDHIIERGLSRLWEIRTSLTTVFAWFQHGLVTPTKMLRALDKIQVEVTMTWDNVNRAIEMVDRAVAEMDFETDIDELIDTLSTMYGKMAELALKKIAAVTRYEGFKKVSETVNEAMRKLMVYKGRYDVDKALAPVHTVMVMTGAVGISSVSIIDANPVG